MHSTRHSWSRKRAHHSWRPSPIETRPRPPGAELSVPGVVLGLNPNGLGIIRSLRMAGDAERLGLYGFGAAAHIVAQVAVHEGRRVFAFTKSGDTAGQEFALSLGAIWAGASDAAPPEALDAAIIFAPVGPLVPTALRSVAKGGTVVCAGIHMSEVPAFPYDVLWGERVVRSVANLTREDGEEFFTVAPSVPVRTEVQGYRLGDANRALEDLRDGRVHGAAVLGIGVGGRGRGSGVRRQGSGNRG